MKTVTLKKTTLGLAILVLAIMVCIITLKKMTLGLAILVLAIMVCIIVAFGVTASGADKEPAEIACTHEENIMTVDDVVSKAGCDYFIVKDINTWAILEPDVYMDREVVEINICDDTPDTLCLFIELAEDETPRIRQITQ